MIDSVIISRTIDDIQTFLGKAAGGDRFYVPLEEVRDHIENLEDELQQSKSWANELKERVETLERDISDQDGFIERLEERIKKAKDVLTGRLE